MKQLDRVSSPELAPLKEKLLLTALAGYQEGILSDLWCDVKQYMRERQIDSLPSGERYTVSMQWQVMEGMDE